MFCIEVGTQLWTRTPYARQNEKRIENLSLVQCIKKLAVAVGAGEQDAGTGTSGRGSSRGSARMQGPRRLAGAALRVPSGGKAAVLGGREGPFGGGGSRRASDQGPS